MANLTFEQGVITRERSDLTPVPNHSLVVYKKVGDSGRQHYLTLPPGDVFKPRLLDRRFDFVCYAVNEDPNQRLTFSRKLKSVDQIHFFTLHSTLHYGVVDAARVTDLWKSDPLRRLQEEVGELLGAEVASIPWAEVRAKNFNSNVVLQWPHAHEDELDLTKLQYLQRFARQLGLDLRSIKLGRSIQLEDLKVDFAKGEKETEGKIKDLEHGESLRDKHRQQELSKLEQQQQLELDATDFQRAQLNDFRRNQQVQDALAENTMEALKNVASNITSAGQLEDAARRLRTIVQGAGVPAATSGGAALGPGAQMGLLPEPATRHHGGVDQLLAEVFERLEQIDSSHGERRKMLAAILHLAGEGLRGTDASEELIKGYQQEIGAFVKELRGRISVDDFRFLNNLSDLARQGRRSDFNEFDRQDREPTASIGQAGNVVQALSAQRAEVVQQDETSNAEIDRLYRELRALTTRAADEPELDEAINARFKDLRELQAREADAIQRRFDEARWLDPARGWRALRKAREILEDEDTTTSDESSES